MGLQQQQQQQQATKKMRSSQLDCSLTRHTAQTCQVTAVVCRKPFKRLLRRDA
jgi:hypothetical protein